MKALSIDQVEAASVLESLSPAEESLLAGGASHFTSEVFFSAESGGLSSSASFSIDGASSISIIADGISVDDIDVNGGHGKFNYLSKASMRVRKGTRSRKTNSVVYFSF